MLKKVFKCSLVACVGILLTSEIVPIGVYASEVEKSKEEIKKSSYEILEEQIQQALTEKDIEKVFNLESEITYDDFSYQEKISNQAVAIIEKKYEDIPEDTNNLNSENEVENTEQYTLNEIDEERVNQAVSEYLNMVGYNPFMTMNRGFGRNWWNSRNFIGQIIDIGLIALGIGTAIRSAQAISRILRANRRNITRVVHNQIMSRVGISVSGFIGAGIDIASVISGVSIGYGIAWGMDYADGRLDGFIWA